MADQTIGELVRADQIRAADLFLLEQNGSAKSLRGQTLLNWLTSAADGHGGIQRIDLVGKTGLVTTYRITLADLTTVDYQVTDGRAITGVKQTSVSGLTRTYTISFNDGGAQTFTVTDGRAITGVKKTATSGLVDTYTVTYNDGSTSTFLVTNGAKGDKGDNAYTWIRYASQQPTEANHSMGTVPDDWMGIYTGTAATAPTDWKQYTWYKIKGDKGDTGDPAQLISSSTTYMVSDSGTIIPSGSWQNSVPTVPQGKYLWTRVIQTYNTGKPVTSYSVSRMGMDGSGSVSAVNGQSPDSNGNVKLTSEDISGSSGQSIAAELTSLQNQITEVDERLAALEHMTLQNQFTAPISIDSTGTTLLVDDLGNAIVADWKYKEV